MSCLMDESNKGVQNGKEASITESKASTGHSVGVIQQRADIDRQLGPWCSPESWTYSVRKRQGSTPKRGNEVMQGDLLKDASKTECEAATGQGNLCNGG